MHDDLLIVRGFDYAIYVLRDGDALYVLDPGFLGGAAVLRRGLTVRGWDKLSLKGILITHAHIDHILNVATMVKETGAWVAVPQLDLPRIEGEYRYRGAARICGVLETTAKRLLGYQTFPVDRWLDDQADLPIWDGLRAVHLPGHTEGHMGFFSESRQILFSGDLFASRGTNAQLPPRVFNSQPELIPASVERARSPNLTGVLPYHCDRATPAEHLARLRRLKLPF